MQNRFKGKSCYYCGEPAISDEHIPPKQIFDGFDCDKIVVPSCMYHNVGKSFYDACILMGMLKSLDEFIISGLANDLTPNILKSIELVQDKFPHVKKGMRIIEIFQEGQPGSEKKMKSAFVDADIDHYKWARLLTAGLIWDATEEYQEELDWNEESGVLDNYFRESTEKGLTATDLIESDREKQKHMTAYGAATWIEGWSAISKPYPRDLYNFRFVYGSLGHLHFEHTFFLKYKIWVHVKASPELAEKVKIKALVRSLKEDGCRKV
ncbi:MAG: hypothetical protein JWO30_2319 [Fibrobacteres bacterium]|nr:hypothetical protein [Fibrobacterota bacterium]